MPCGGIYPIRGSDIEEFISFGVCFSCNCDTNVSDLWVEEWDAPLHRSCLEEFKKSEEYKVIERHGHEVIL